MREQIGKGGDRLMPESLSEKELEEFSEKLEKQRIKLFDNDYLPKTKPFPKLREPGERFKKDGVKIVIASSATGNEVEFFKKAMNQPRFFPLPVSARMPKNNKAAPPTANPIFAAAGSGVALSAIGASSGRI